MMPTDVIAALGAGLVLVSITYWLLTTAWLEKWLRSEAPDLARAPSASFTFFRPLKAGVADLREKLRRFIEETREQDQILFGVEPDTSEAQICQALASVFPARDIKVVSCERGVALNPKISKLLQMACHARYENWGVIDSEFVPEPGWLERFRQEWSVSGNDAFTAGYRFVETGTFVQGLDALPILLTLWPGLSVVLRGDRLNFMLGAVIAVRQRDLEALGGWSAFGRDLAEDNRLGAALVRTGKSIGLSRQIASLSSDELNWRDYWKHQRRVAVTYRACNAAGFAGMICTHGISIASALLFLRPSSIPIWVLFAVTVASRWWTAKRLASLLRFSIPHLSFSAVLASLVETACWFAAWGAAKVWWAGRRWAVGNDGTLRMDQAVPRLPGPL